MNLEELHDYKNLLMKDLCTNERIVKLLTGKQDAAVPNHGLPYTQVYPYPNIPETVNEGKTYICFDVDLMSVPNKTYYIPVLYIWVFTHKSRMRIEKELGGGILLDELCRSINEFINGSRYYGLGETKLDSVRAFTPITDYYGKTLTYYLRDFNRPKGRIDAPINRKKGQ